jgi:hypothetical protein
LSRPEINHFIKNVFIKEIALCWKVSGGVGVMIYNYIKFRVGVDKHRTYINGVPLSNKYFYDNGICRESKYLALRKLKNAGLINVIERKGAAPLVKLAFKS